jgi:hypothetical protein
MTKKLLSHEAAQKKKPLLKSMRALRKKMIAVATEFNYFGEFDVDSQAHSLQLLGAAGMLQSWIGGIEQDWGTS